MLGDGLRLGCGTAQRPAHSSESTRPDILDTVRPGHLVVLALLGLGCGVLEAPVAPDLPGNLETTRIEVDGRERGWISYVPASRATPASLVLALPGSGQSAEALRASTRYRLEELAERDGFVVVYAEAWAEGGAGGYEWNDCRKNTPQPAHLENVDDVGFLIGVLERFVASEPIDPRRVYVFGVSDGGQMANRMTTEHTARFAAFASIIAQQTAPANSNCLDPQGPIPALFMGGTDDPVIPWQGGVAGIWWIPGATAGEVLSMDETIAHWRARNGTTTDGISTVLPDADPGDESTMVRTIWDGPAPVVLYEARGGGHTIPGGWMGVPEFILGHTNGDVQAMDEIWSFFREHVRD